MRTFITRSLLVAVSMTLVGACGDDKKVLKKADFIKQADAICLAASAESDKLGSPTSEKELLALVPKLADIQLKSLAKIKALGEPDTEAAKVNKLLADITKVFTTLRASTSMKEFQKSAASVDGLNKVATDYGFKECGSG